MKINLDDPQLTAFALGELSPNESSAMAAAIAASPEAQAYVAETRELAGLLQKEFRAELGGTGAVPSGLNLDATAGVPPAKPRNIMPLPAPRSFWSDARWLSAGIAALLAVCAVIGAVALSQRGTINHNYALGGNESGPGAEVKATPPAEVQMEVETPADETEPPVLAQNFAEESASSSQAAPTLRMKVRRGEVATESFGYKAQGKTERRPEVFSSAKNFNTAEYDQFDENPFLPAASNPLSTFSVDVD
ncbi:MAG: von Willebrand factor type A domain-containing protein, partial [Verrucomicrobiota bacterium]|nr:von Willebrand factor type A domain-containing protein [Verrucomicrobiota bacterium]